MENNTKGFKKSILIVFLSMCFIIIAIPGLCENAKKVAVIPFSMNSAQDLSFLQNGLFDMLSSRLSDPGKVDVLDRETVDKVMIKAKESDAVKGAINESKARIIGANMGVDYVLFGSLTNFGDSISLDTSMVDITGKKETLTFFKQSNTMGDVIPMINTFAGDINLKVFNRNISNEMYARPQQQAPQAPGSFQSMDEAAGEYGSGFVDLRNAGQKGFTTYLKFKGQINALAAGDLNKDGLVQVVAATDSQIIIYTLNGNKLSVQKTLDFSFTNRIVSLDIADINKNGYPEIFVTSLNSLRTSLQSFVVEYNGSAYHTLTDNESYYFRVIDGENGGKILLGQRSAGHPYKGKIYVMTATGNTYSEQRKLPLPRSVSALSLTRGMSGTGDAQEYVLINENGNMVVAGDSGRIEWESSKEYGGTPHYFQIRTDSKTNDGSEMVYLNQRVVFYDVGNDGKSEILAIQNMRKGSGLLQQFNRFEKGTLEILSWNGIALAPVFKTRSLQGWMSDFAIADIDNDGQDEIIVSAIGKTKFGIGTKKITSNIIAYKLK